MLKRKITSLMTIVLLSSTAYGADVTSDKLSVVSDLNVKLGAFVGFESGGSNQNKRKGAENNLSANRSGFAFYSDTALHAVISKDLDGIEYGGKIILVPTAKRKSIPTYNGTHIFVKSEFGRMELGSPIPVAANMMISSGSVPSKYINLKTAHMKQGKDSAPSFLTSNGCFVGDELTASTDKAPYSNEPPRTINFYTPKFTIGEVNKVQIGVSYTPDTANTGADSIQEKSDGIQKKTIGADGVHKFELDRSVKDAITAGLVIDHAISDTSSLKIVLTGEYGKAAGHAKKYATKDAKEHSKHKLANLRSYNIGGELKIDNLTYSACYGSHGKSLTTSELHRAGQKSHYYSAGISHKYNSLTTDVTYFVSEKFKNKVNSIQLKGTYAMAKGLKPYLSVTHFNAKGRSEYHSELKHRKTHGVVLLTGLKLSL